VDIWKIELANDKVKIELHEIPGFDAQRIAALSLKQR